MTTADRGRGTYSGGAAIGCTSATTAASQLIPLLFITILIEHRLLQRPLLNTARRRFISACVYAFIAWTCLAFAVTEMDVLKALHDEQAPTWLGDDIRATLIMATLALVAPIFLRVIWHEDGLRPARTVGAVFVGWLAFGLIFTPLAVWTR